MENLKMSVSSFNNEEVVQLLLKALELSNGKCQALANTLANLQDQKQEMELAKTQITLEKDNVIGSLNTKIGLLNNELEKNMKSLADLKLESTREIQQLVEKHKSAIEELERKQMEALSAKDSVIIKKEEGIASARLELEGKDETINQLNDRLVILQKEFEQFKINTFQNIISQYLGELKLDCGLLNADDFCGLKQYIDNIGNSTSLLTQDYDTVESFCRVLLSPDGLISCVCNLIWWLNNEQIKNEYKESNDIFKHIVCLSNAIVDFFMRFGYTIALPPSKFCSKLEDYSLYDNANSHIEDIFPNVTFEKSVLCEIYTVSYNNIKGKCYSL